MVVTDVTADVVTQRDQDCAVLRPFHSSYAKENFFDTSKARRSLAPSDLAELLNDFVAVRELRPSDYPELETSSSSFDQVVNALAHSTRGCESENQCRRILFYLHSYSAPEAVPVTAV